LEPLQFRVERERYCFRQLGFAQPGRPSTRMGFWITPAR
jgi:hypothetical protein